jgi:hypothetical protein
MAVVDVTIRQDSAGTGCTVSPSEAKLKNGRDDIRWSNETGDKVVVFMPHDGVLGDADHFHQTIHDTKKHQRTGPSSGTPKGGYKYAIYCDATGTFATGSDPEIIVQ